MLLVLTFWGETFTASGPKLDPLGNLPKTREHVSPSWHCGGEKLQGFRGLTTFSSCFFHLGRQETQVTLSLGFLPWEPEGTDINHPFNCKEMV